MTDENVRAKKDDVTKLREEARAGAQAVVDCAFARLEADAATDISDDEQEAMTTLQIIDLEDRVDALEAAVADLRREVKGGADADDEG